MTDVLFEYPKSAAFGCILPKNKIYVHGSPSTAVKDLFVRQVERISWQYKLAPETINLSSTRAVPEIQVFRIELRTGELKQDVLYCIDRAINFPIIFELHYEEQVKCSAAYKRPSEADNSKWVLGSYFETPWISSSTPRIPLPIVLDLEALYAQILMPLMPCEPRQREGLQAFVDRMELIRSRQRELEKCEIRLRKEKQFNRKVEINAELRAIKQELENLRLELVTA